MSAPESATAALRRSARDNATSADRLEVAGHGELAAVYRETACAHEAAAERVEGGARGPWAVRPE